MIIPYKEQHIEKIVANRLYEEVKKGIQIIQYQLITLMTTNGQSPFISIFMYLNEAKTPQREKRFGFID